MLPLGNRVAVHRVSGEEVRPSGLVLPPPDLGFAHIGVVTAAGRAIDADELRPGTRVIYSSRVDTFVLDDGSTIDIVEQNSVIGTMQ